MATFMGLVTLLCLIMAVVGLFSPKTILPKEDNPSRGRAVAASAALWLVIIAAASIWGAVFGTDEKAVVKGIGVSVSTLQAEFDKAGVKQVSNTDAQGRPVINGQFPAAITQIVGDGEALSASVTGFMGADQTSNLTVAMLMATMVGTVFPGWKEWFPWFQQAVEKSGDETIHDGRLVKVVVVRQHGMVQVFIDPAR